MEGLFFGILRYLVTVLDSTHASSKAPFSNKFSFLYWLDSRMDTQKLFFPLAQDRIFAIVSSNKLRAGILAQTVDAWTNQYQ